MQKDKGIVEIESNLTVNRIGVSDSCKSDNRKKCELNNQLFSNKDINEKLFSEKLRKFVDTVFIIKGKIYELDVKNNTIISDAIECLEKAKYITKKFNLKFERKIIDEIRYTISNMERLSLFQAVALLHISDVVSIYENAEELEDEDFKLVRENFRILKSQVFSEFEKDEWNLNTKD